MHAWLTSCHCSKWSHFVLLFRIRREHTGGVCNLIHESILPSPPPFPLSLWLFFLCSPIYTHINTPICTPPLHPPPGTALSHNESEASEIIVWFLTKYEHNRPTGPLPRWREPGRCSVGFVKVREWTQLLTNDCLIFALSTISLKTRLWDWISQIWAGARNQRLRLRVRIHDLKPAASTHVVVLVVLIHMRYARVAQLSRH